MINEEREAERIIETNKYDSLSSAVSLIIRYYIQIKEMSNDEVKSKVKSFLELNHCEFDKWKRFIKRVIKNSDKYPICRLNEIPITQKEIDIIKSAGSDKKEKILFTFLVIGKLKYLKSGDAWVNDTSKKIFEQANTSPRADERDYIIRDFYESNIVSYAKSPMNLSIHIDFVDPDGEPVFTVKDLRNLGFRWMKYKGDNYVECQSCGIIFKPTKMNARYCKECRGYVPLKTKIVECCEPDCGISFETPANNRSNRCPSCSYKRRLKQVRNNMKKYRNK